MEQQKRHDIALMKYSAIAPVISGLPAGYHSFSEYFREVSEKGIPHPDGSLRHYAPTTISKWYEISEGREPFSQASATAAWSSRGIWEEGTREDGRSA